MRFGPVVILLAGAALLLNGLRFLVLLVGAVGAGRVEYSLPGTGAGDVSWEVHYVFRAGEKNAKGSATASESLRREAPLSIRYLPFLPAINHPDDRGMLLTYGLLSSLPGLILLYFAQRSLRRPQHLQERTRIP